MTHQNMTPSPIPAALLDALKVVERPSAFAVSGSLPISIPDLEIEGVGPVAFPLLPIQASLIKAVAERAPYGRGDKTLVDLDVRRVWQLPLDRFRLSDASFKGRLKSIVGQVKAELGLTGTIAAEPYKLLLYEEGSFFISHRDSEKAPGMFGTLVVVLPSRFEGGALVVRHAGEERRIELEVGGPSEVAWAAFYADCEHELEPLTGGYRLALVYNLIHRGRGKALTAPDHRAPVESCVEILKGWSAVTAPAKLLFVLDHRYTPAGLGWAGLKGEDAARASVLCAAAREAGCEVSLGMISIEEHGSAEFLGEYGGRRGRWSRYDPDDPESYEEIEVTERSEAVVDLMDEGGRPRGLPPLGYGGDEICPPGALEGASPDEECFTEATGNEGASFERTWRFAAIVIWPRRHRVRVLAQAGTSAALAWLEGAVRDLTPGQPSPEREDAIELARAILDGWPAPMIRGVEQTLLDLEDRSYRPDEGAARMLATLLRLGEPALLERFVAVGILPHRFNGKANEGLVQLAAVLGWERAPALLRQIVETHGRRSLGPCIELATRVAKALGEAPDPAAADLLQDLCQALSDRLPTLAASGPGQPWEGPVPPKTLTALLELVVAASDTPSMATIEAHALGYPTRFPLDGTLIPALLSLGAIQGDVGPAELIDRCVEHLRERASEIPVPPSDASREVHLRCTCASCGELKAFLRHPAQLEWTFKARKELRQHVATQAQSHDVTCQHLKQGSPQGLHCVKNQASFERRRAQRAEDLRALAKLGSPMPS